MSLANPWESWPWCDTPLALFQLYDWVKGPSGVIRVKGPPGVPFWGRWWCPHPRLFTCAGSPVQPVSLIFKDMGGERKMRLWLIQKYHTNYSSGLRVLVVQWPVTKLTLDDCIFMLKNSRPTLWSRFWFLTQQSFERGKSYLTLAPWLYTYCPCEHPGLPWQGEPAEAWETQEVVSIV